MQQQAILICRDYNYNICMINGKKENIKMCMENKISEQNY